MKEDWELENFERKICYIEWRDDKPFDVTLDDGDSYDIDFTKFGDGYYHWSGGGIDLKNKELYMNGVDKLPTGVTTFEELIEHYELIEGRTFWCEICKSRWSENSPCKHVEWCDDCAAYHIPNKHN